MNLSQEALDSYDDDLAWIAEKLTLRAGASFGFIFRVIRQEPVVLMAAAAGEADAPLARCSALAETIRKSWTDWPVQGTELLHELMVLPDCSTPESLKLLYMAFQPAPDVVIVAAVCRNASSFNMLHDLVARRLQPVLLRYVRLWWLHRTERRQASALTRILDAADIGIAVLDRHANLLVANRALQELLVRGDGLLAAGRGITPACPEDGVHLQAVLRQAIQANQTGTGEVAHSPMLTLRRTAGRRSLIVTALTVGTVAIDPKDAAVALYVVDPEKGYQLALEPVCRIYGLTPAESRLVSQLVEGASVTKAAEQMKVSSLTARTYLKQVFGKTNTNRQSDLVRVMLVSASRTSLGLDLSRI